MKSLLLLRNNMMKAKRSRDNLIKGVIFDLDGTLLDSMTVWSSIDREFLIENGISDPPPEVSDVVKKMTVDESSQYFIDRFGLHCTKEYVIKRIEDMVRQRYEEQIPLKPHAEEVLDFLDSRNVPYGIATATYKGLAEAALKRCGVYDRFRFLLTDREYPAGKNYPDIFLGGAQRLGAQPDETLVIEDSLHCIETAKSAGFTVCGVYDSVAEADSGRIKELSDFYVKSLDGIIQII
ncbi:haloacid dehalogenase superfamily, subfamily IA, variant 3 with third motif having DD or ED [Ruminococcus flavefaciens]|uniref:HAD superfamily hydrolase (TIGR01509 family) n=2 Tax=Ruminococcus flavefaciens TaxID=1265 RepID=A0A315XUR6_RUMFL|nr:HAD superfamily hydrolase (TIGR01509 family) [Ruminococcus flavefaciens]SSA51319.1 haloacid dehalogenase superfamily, subfamily IA, variant 3 with third motif having DD or ED [Ruminococcus flavefaciens]